MTTYAKVPGSNDLIVALENFADDTDSAYRLRKGKMFAFPKPKNMPGNAQEIDLSVLASKMQNMVNFIDQNFVDRREYIELVFNAYASGENLLTYGVPGTAKTAINTVIMKAFSGKGFNYSLTNDTSDSDVFGPKSAKEYRENDRWIRNTENTLADTDKSFLDEIGKATKRVFSMLMQALESGVVSDGSTTINMSNHVTVAASNEDLSEAMQGLDRRFSLRYEMPEITDPAKMKQIMMAQGDSMFIPDHLKIDLDHVRLLSGVAEVLAKYCPEESLVDFYLEVWQEIESAGFHVDNSTVGKSLKMVVASALWQGYGLAGESIPEKFVSVTADVFWRKRSDREKVREIVLSKCDPDQAVMIEIRKLCADVDKLFSDLENAPNRGNNAEYHNATGDFKIEATRVMGYVYELADKLTDKGYKTEVETLTDNIEEMKSKTKKLALNI